MSRPEYPVDLPAVVDGSAEPYPSVARLATPVVRVRPEWAVSKSRRWLVRGLLLAAGMIGATGTDELLHGGSTPAASPLWLYVALFATGLPVAALLGLGVRSGAARDVLVEVYETDLHMQVLAAAIGFVFRWLVFTAGMSLHPESHVVLMLLGALVLLPPIYGFFFLVGRVGLAAGRATRRTQQRRARNGRSR